MSPCSEEECPKYALSVKGCTTMSVHISATSHLQQTVVSSVQRCVHGCVNLGHSDQGTVAWLPVCYQGDSKWLF